MDWYYAHNNQPAGPVGDAELARLAQTGVVTGTTLVWHGGMANWLSYDEARRAAASAAVAFPPVPAAALTPGVAAGPGQARCSQCGQVFPGDEIVRVGQYDVCAQCKPVLIQKLREGVLDSRSPVASLAYAGFGIRLGAAFLDAIILIPLFLLIYGGYFFLYGNHFAELLNPNNVDALRAFQRVAIVYGLALTMLQGVYSAFCVSRFGGTPGKRICELRVVRGSGARVTFGRGFGRYCAKQLPRTIPILGLVYLAVDSLFICFDAERRSLHDQICDTRVVYSK